MKMINLIIIQLFINQIANRIIRFRREIEILYLSNDL